MEDFDELFSKAKMAFSQNRVWLRANLLAKGIINSFGRGTITSWLSGSGLQFRDWSGFYRIFKQGGVDEEKLFDVVRQETIRSLPENTSDIIAHMDDTLFRKSGKKVNGVRWTRDPLGPPFQTNLVLGQRFVELTISKMEDSGPCPAVSIPVDLFHCPAMQKPKDDASLEDKQAYNSSQKKEKLSAVGTERLNQLRKKLDKDGHAQRRLVVSVDGSFTNSTVLKNLNPNIVLIGRVRKDSVLYARPDGQEAKGRKRVYGDKLPTPEQVRQSEDYPWQTIKAFAAGKLHEFDVKIVKGVRWRKSGKKDLQMMVIRPVAYRKTKKSKILYRQPAYLLCTDPQMKPQKLLQTYLWRWGIEVNFKEQKTFLGCGKAQVRKKESCQKVPAFLTAVYSMILLANSKSQKQVLPRPKWYPVKKAKEYKPTTGDAINNLRAMSWSMQMKISFSHLVNLDKVARSRKNATNPLLSAVFYNRK